MQQRSAELIGLALGLLGLALLVALACYDPRDPSLNTATSRQTSNLAGPVGAVLADLLLQGFGVAGALLLAGGAALRRGPVCGTETPGMAPYDGGPSRVVIRNFSPPGPEMRFDVLMAPADASP